MPDNYTELVRKYYEKLGATGDLALRRSFLRRVVAAAGQWRVVLLASALIWSGHPAVPRSAGCGWAAVLKLIGIVLLALALLFAMGQAAGTTGAKSLRCWRTTARACR